MHQGRGGGEPSGKDMTQFHLDPETIAEYQAGALGFWHVVRRRRIAAHLAGCPDCSALARQLTQVSEILAAAPRPAMPADVAERLTAVLATEPPPSIPRTAHGRSSRLLAASGGPRRPRLVPATAVLVVLVALGIGGYTLSQPSAPSGHPATSNAASLPTSSAVNGRLTPDHVGTGHAATNGGQESYRVVASGTDYLRQSLRAQIIQETKASPLSVAAPPGALAGCVARVGAGFAVTFVDLARYQGRKAWVMASAGHAWVTGTSCSASRSDLLASVALAAPS